MTWEVKIIDGVPRKIHQVVVHHFLLGDIENPDLYAAEPLYKWQQSEEGQFVMSHAVETPIWKTQHDVTSFSTKYIIIAKLYDEDFTYYTLRYK